MCATEHVILTDVSPFDCTSDVTESSWLNYDPGVPRQSLRVIPEAAQPCSRRQAGTSVAMMLYCLAAFIEKNWVVDERMI